MSTAVAMAFRVVAALSSMYSVIVTLYIAEIEYQEYGFSHHDKQSLEQNGALSQTSS